MLEKVNERAVRFIFNDRSTPYRELLKKLGLTTLLRTKKHSRPDKQTKHDLQP